MQKRLAVAERVMQLRKEQDQQLRDSIVLARQQVRLRLPFFKCTQRFPTQYRLNGQWEHRLWCSDKAVNRRRWISLHST